MAYERKRSCLHGNEALCVPVRICSTLKEQDVEAAYAEVYETATAVCHKGAKVCYHCALPSQPIYPIEVLLDELSSLRRFGGIIMVESLACKQQCILLHRLQHFGLSYHTALPSIMAHSCCNAEIIYQQCSEGCVFGLEVKEYNMQAV